MAISQDQANQLASAYQSGDTSAVQNLVNTMGVTANDVSTYFPGFDVASSDISLPSAPLSTPTPTPTDIQNFVAANLDNPQAIADAAAQYGVSSTDIAQAMNVDVDVVSNYFTNANVQAPPVMTPSETIVAASPTPVPTPTPSPTPTPTYSSAADVLNGLSLGALNQTTAIPALQQVASSGDSSPLSSGNNSTSNSSPIATPSDSSLVNNWFSANPNATQADAASAVQSIGGLTPDLASALATYYGTTADVVNNAYSQLTSSTPTPTPTPVNTASSPLSSGNNSTLTQYNAFTSNNVGGVGTSYGQASPDLISQAQQSNPALATALQNGTAQYNVDDTGNGYLVDTSTGQPIGGNYTVSSTPSGQTAINIPTNNGGMIQAIAGTDPNGNGMLSPVSANNVFNVGLNAGAQGFAGGISQPVASFSPMLAMNPVTAPFLAAYNVANDVASGQVNANTLLNGFNAYTGLTGPSPTLVDQIPSADGTTMTNVYQDASGNITQKVVDASSISQGSSSNLFSPQNVANVKGALNFTNSVANNNPLGIISSGLGLASNNGITVDPNINTALTVGTFVKNLESGNISGMINNAMSLAKSSNPIIASSAQKVVDASTSGDQNAVVTASTELGKVLNSDSDSNSNSPLASGSASTSTGTSPLSGATTSPVTSSSVTGTPLDPMSTSVLPSIDPSTQSIIDSLGKTNTTPGVNVASINSNPSDSTSASTTPTYSQLYNYAMSQTDKNGNPITPQMAELFALNGGQGSMTNTMLDLGTVGGYPNGMPIVPPATLGSSGVGTTPNVNNGGTNAPSYIPLDKLDVGNPLVTNANNAINTAIDTNGVPEGTDLSGGTYVKSENDPDTGETTFSVQKPISFTNPDGQSTGYTIMYEPTSGKTMYVYQQYNSDTQNWTIAQSTKPPIFNDQSQQFDNIKPLDVPPDVKDNQPSTSNATTPSPLANSGITPNATVDVNSKVNSPLVTDQPISNTVVPDIVSPFATQSGSSGASKVPSNNSGPLGSNATSANTTSPNETSPLGGGIVSNTNPDYNNFGVAPTSSPTPNDTPTPSPLAPNGTPNGTPNATPVDPTATPVAPTPTPTSTPTPTPSSTPTPTSSPTPTPTPTPTPSQSTASTSGGGAPTNSALAMVATMLAGAPVYGQQAHLKKLQQLYDSLDPGLAKILANEGIKAPQEPKQQEQSDQLSADQLAELNKEIKAEQPPNAQPFLLADGGTVEELLKNNQYRNIAPATEPMLKAAPIVQQESRFSPLKYLKQGIRREAQPTSLLAHGGVPHKYREASPKGHNPEFITGLTGYYASGRGTGQSDDISAMLHDGDYVMDADTVASFGDGSSKAGAQVMDKFHHMVPHNMSEGGSPVPAKIADGEYVFPESFVTALGGGDNKLGSKLLDTMREELRAHKRSAPDTKIPPKAKSPLQYLSEAKKQGIERK